ncbi:MAG: O-antigen ligase family protein [Pseudomonadota bacterium]
MFIFAAINAAWLAVGISKNWLVIEKPAHPLLYGLLAWVAWQLVVLLTSKSPVNSWFGLPQLGEGAGWQVMLLLSFAMAMPLWQINKHKKIMLVVATLALGIMTYLHFNPKVLCDRQMDNYFSDNPAAPANWPDYLPFIAGWLWIAYASSPNIRSKRWHVGLIALLSTVLLVGQNSSARGMLFPTLIILSLILLLRLIKQKPEWITQLISTNKLWRNLAVFGCMLPLIWIVISQNQNLFSCKNASLSTRAIYNKVAVTAILEDPSRLAFGNGWGNFSDDMFKYGMTEGLTSYDNGILKPNSLWLYGSVFHPHNQPVQALLATGIIGFLIFITLPILAILPLRKSLFWWCVPIVLVLNAMSSLWFLLPQVMNFQALGLAALCGGRPARIRKTGAIPFYMSVICAAFVLLFSASAYEQLNIIRYGEQLKVIMREDPNKPEIVQWIMQDVTHGGKRMAEAINYFSKEITDKVNNEIVSEIDRDWYRNFLEIAHLVAQQSYAGIELKKLELDLYRQVFELPKASILDSLKPQAKSRLVAAMIAFSKAYPEREDYIAPFLFNLDGLTDGDKIKQRDILNYILEAAANHRSALWLIGTLDEESPETQEKGREMKKLAVKSGVERVYPVTKQELSPYQ